MEKLTKQRRDGIRPGNDRRPLWELWETIRKLKEGGVIEEV